VNETARQPTDNNLLAGMAAPELERLLPKLQWCAPEIRFLVYEPGGPIDDVYFPLTAVFSLLAGVGEREVEVSTIGCEGMVGLPVFLGARTSPNRAFCQVAGEALRVKATDLMEFLNNGADGSLHSQLHRYTQATMVQLAQSVACNQLHAAHQRAARWLLMTRDRVGSETFPLTQEFLAQMLGVRRATVSEVAAQLMDDDIISYRRGVVQIHDPRRLEAVSCECYRIVQAEYTGLVDREE
jgi:CRP-like cAMP-binding protein